MELTGKVALVTGAAKRLGLAMALALAEQGAAVAVHYGRSREEAEAVVDDIKAEGIAAIAVGADLREVEQIDRMVKQVEEALGPVDVLINSASLFQRTSFGTVTSEQWDNLVNSNLRGPFFLAQCVAEGMKQRGEGKIVNFGDANTPYAVPDFLPYSITKAGIEAMTRGLARALAPEIQVNAILPGAILPASGGNEAGWDAAVNANLLKKGGDAADIVNAMLYLIENDFLTGVMLPVDGGRRLGR